MNKIAILLDIGYGNFPRLTSFLVNLGYEVKIKKVTSKIEEANLLIIPGIGNFNIIKNIQHRSNIKKYIKRYKENGNFILCICLEMQILCDKNEESEDKSKGLGIFPFPVKKLNCNLATNRVPRIGWYNSKSMENTIFHRKLYYSHSYYVECKNKKYIKMITKHGNLKLPAIIQKENVIGFQFHPELSGNSGIEIFKNIIR